MIDTIAKRLATLIDRARYRFWLQYQNGNAEVLAMHEAMDDARDCMDSIINAIYDGDYDEASRLAHMSRDRIEEHVETLRGLL